jgi:hypothetical protein
MRKALYVNDASLLEYRDDTGEVYIDGMPLGQLVKPNLPEIDKRHEDFVKAAEARG